MDSQKLLEIKKDPRKALDFAKAYTKEGKYEEALEMHEWFYFNALSIQPSLSGVRLSFALSYWMKLAEKYPQAKNRLIEIRDEGALKLKSEVWKSQNFREVINISIYLKDNNTPIEIFKVICQKQIDKEEIIKCYNFVFKLLVENGEAELCRKYFGDPLKYVSTYINEFNESEISLKEFINKMVDKEKKKDVIHEMKKSSGRIYNDKISLLVSALKLIGRNEEIKEVYKAGKGIIPEEEYDKI